MGRGAPQGWGNLLGASQLDIPGEAVMGDVGSEVGAEQLWGRRLPHCQPPQGLCGISPGGGRVAGTEIPARSHWRRSVGDTGLGGSRRETHRTGGPNSSFCSKIGRGICQFLGGLRPSGSSGSLSPCRLAGEREQPQGGGSRVWAQSGGWCVF